jgi:AraC-like DNA-binding protein
MPAVKSHPTNPRELAWLLEASESLLPVSESSPICVRHGTIPEGPPRPHPEWHPYCEISIRLEGEGRMFVEKEHSYAKAGDVLMLGPGVPHWGVIEKYPLRFVTVYFLPWVPIEMGPETEGIRVLRRFTARQSLAERLLRPPRQLLIRLTAQFRDMVTESEGAQVGREIRLRTLLMEQLITILRWEQRQGRNIGGEDLAEDWRPLMKTLQFLRTHYSEPVYAREVARAAGLSESRLKQLFQQALGMSWVRFLQGYRIHRAAALLNESGYNVTEAALAVGFDSFAHFNKTFRAFMGVSPRDYHYGLGPRSKAPGGVDLNASPAAYERFEELPPGKGNGGF